MVLTLYQVRGYLMVNEVPPAHLTEELPWNE